MYRLSRAPADGAAPLTSAALLGPRDVAIAISHTGMTMDMIEALRDLSWPAEQRPVSTSWFAFPGGARERGPVRGYLRAAA